MKTIGVLGGLGPQATMDFEERLHRFSQTVIPQSGNSGYPPLIVYYHRNPPILFGEDGQPIHPPQPDPRLLQAVKQIGQMADFLVITANGPHIFQADIEKASGLPLLSMVGETLAEVDRRKWQKVGVLGLGKPTVYLKPLAEKDVICETIPDLLQKELDEAILGLMAGKVDDVTTAVAWKAINYLQAEGVDGIIPGCTEIPLLLGGIDAEPDMVNPSQILAEAAVHFALA